jgi:hypothetical protein
MFRAVWNGAGLAESDYTVKLGGNHYCVSRGHARSDWRAVALMG